MLFCFAGFVSVAAQRAGVTCAAHRAALFRAGGLLIPALRAG
ncbi:hypothetical protein A2U01_0115338, partial [Trifolium medium]|nr:hypothetical protein [Trifolium medium]